MSHTQFCSRSLLNAECFLCPGCVCFQAIKFSTYTLKKLKHLRPSWVKKKERLNFLWIISNWISKDPFHPSYMREDCRRQRDPTFLLPFCLDDGWGSLEFLLSRGNLKTNPPHLLTCKDGFTDRSSRLLILTCDINGQTLRRGLQEVSHEQLLWTAGNTASDHPGSEEPEVLGTVHGSSYFISSPGDFWGS